MYANGRMEYAVKYQKTIRLLISGNLLKNALIINQFKRKKHIVEKKILVAMIRLKLKYRKLMEDMRQKTFCVNIVIQI